MKQSKLTGTGRERNKWKQWAWKVVWRKAETRGIRLQFSRRNERARLQSWTGKGEQGGRASCRQKTEDQGTADQGARRMDRMSRRMDRNPEWEGKVSGQVSDHTLPVSEVQVLVSCHGNRSSLGAEKETFLLFQPWNHALSEGFASGQYFKFDSQTNISAHKTIRGAPTDDQNRRIFRVAIKLYYQNGF